MDVVENIYFVAAFEQFGAMFLILANPLEVILAGLLNGLVVKWCLILLFHLSQTTFRLAVIISLSLAEPVSFWLLFFFCGMLSNSPEFFFAV